MIQKLRHIKSVVKELLEKTPHLQGSDNRLICTVWHNQLGGQIGVDRLTAMELLQKIARGELSSAESIMRGRRKVQEENPLLRGKSYKARKQKQVEVRTNIHTV